MEQRKKQDQDLRRPGQDQGLDVPKVTSEMLLLSGGTSMPIQNAGPWY